MYRYRRFIRALSLAAAAALGAGCATTPDAGLSVEEIVAQRGQERWEHIFSGDYDVAYEYLSPGYRGKYTRTEYMMRLATQRVRWTAAEFQGAECEGETCLATWEITWRYDVPVRMVGVYKGQKTLKERWIRADGQWYFVPTL